jgi:hypothetical protein
MPSSVYDLMMHLIIHINKKKMPDRKISYYGSLNAITKSKGRFMLWMEDSIAYEGQIIDHMRKLQDEI